MSSGVFRKALEIFRERGGANAYLVDSSGRCCVLGAVALAKGFDAQRLSRDSLDRDDEYAESVYYLPEAKLLDDVATDLWPHEGLEYVTGEDRYMRRAYDVNDSYGPGAAEFLLEQAAELEAEEAEDES